MLFQSCLSNFACVRMNVCTITTHTQYGNVHVHTSQLLQLGNFYILAVPTEMTTMSGRRVRAAVKAAIDANTGRSDATVVIAGLSNAYADYTTTFEEYQAQRYEGGSTIYGVCVCACVCGVCVFIVCVRACVRACVRVCE